MDDTLALVKALYLYIEENIHEPLTLDMLEKTSGLSRFQINRLFIRTCGYSPVAYIRRRKLSHSMPALFSRQRLLDIALDYGFEHEQSYIRAFRAVYASSPAQYSKTNANATLTEPPLLDTIHLHADGFFIDPAVQYHTACTIAGVETAYNYMDIDNGTSLHKALQNQPVQQITMVCYPAKQGSFSQRYVHTIPDGETYTIPAGRYLVLEYTGLHTLDKLGARKIRTLMYMIVEEWFAANKLIWQHHFVERVDMSILRERYCEMQIAIPLEHWY